MEAVFGRLKRAPAYKVLADQVSREILEGRIKEGQLLPTESELAQQFGASRSTVREGMRQLEETGLVRRENGKRLVVCRPSGDIISTQLERTIILNQVSFREVWESAMVFEPAMAGAAAAQMTPTDARALRDNVERTRAAVASGAPLLELDIEFHALVAKATHNTVLLLTRAPLERLFYPAFSTIFDRVPHASERLLQAHQGILDALTDADPEGAQRWMLKHIQDFQRGWKAARLDMEQPVNASWES